MESTLRRSWRWTPAAVVLFSIAALLNGRTVAAAPTKTSSRALAQRLAPALIHKLGEGRVPPVLMEEIVADFEDPDLMDFYDAEKRQFDEYGHMRFGKRSGGDYDDYGHLRFGRSLIGKLHH
ncbi:hypothetical protein SK128_012695 [Halocaridina rubra]|uniref:Sulfakinin n=1 Tax=Halocaridina rubra TaxID=373956 RepID=A0AAN8X8H3_HALRR